MDSYSDLLFSKNISLEELIYLVEEKGADIESVDENRNSVLITYCNNKQNNLVKYLISKGVNINKENLSTSYVDLPLLRYCHTDKMNDNDLEMVKLLVENGADLEVIGFYRFTAFMNSIYGNRLDIY